jgi:hypothetical protein
MTEENFDWKAAKAVEEYYKLKRETRELESKILKNREQMKALLADFPQIGNINGMLRKEKKKKEKEKKIDDTAVSEESESTSKSEKSGAAGQKRKSPETPSKPLSTILKESEAKRAKKTDAQKGRTAAIERGGTEFHSSSHSNPPPVEKSGGN